MKLMLALKNLWSYVQILKHTTNVRVVLGTHGNAATFAEILLNIGNGTQQKKSATLVINPSFVTSVSGQDELISTEYQEISEISEKTNH